MKLYNSNAICMQIISIILRKDCSSFFFFKRAYILPQNDNNDNFMISDNFHGSINRLNKLAQRIINIKIGTATLFVHVQIGFRTNLFHVLVILRICKSLTRKARAECA